MAQTVERRRPRRIDLRVEIGLHPESTRDAMICDTAAHSVVHGEAG
jgi:hypothetical protein